MSRRRIGRGTGAPLSMAGVWKSYGTRSVLRGVDVTVEPGSLLGVTGENGTGKTTLLRTMVGELAPDRGLVHREGQIGYCPQETVVNPLLSVSQHLELFRVAYGLPDTGHARELLGTLGCPDTTGQRVGTLSGGTRQKLNLVLALMNRPTLLVLDEPYQGFDWDTHRRFWRLARKFRDEGQAVVVVSHLLGDLQHFDRVYELRDGVLSEGCRQR
ncbi:ATP-binding cassette domain-containing protein [Streptomyces sp. NPDC057411]|uniref:ATP-binding cassette domain-containing protein n=1 Tax=unclassified Streptomyces TaxID=2593676 RepID=UPI0036301273